MITFSSDRLGEIKNSFAKKRIAVIGDMMLDGYFWGDVKRISPEAPVPIVEVDDEFFKFGGAANVALNISKLGGTPLPIGVIGTDSDADIFTSLLTEANMVADCLIKDSSRPTTNKTRVIADNQQIVRIDKESKEPINIDIEKKIFNSINKNIKEIDAIILQDYNKGVLTSSLIEKVIKLANDNNVIITVDPKFTNFFSYENVTVFKPNRKETEDVLGIRFETAEDLKKAGEVLLNKLSVKYVLLTLGEEGIVLFEKGKEFKQIPTKARKVADVSGAGDTVISTLTMALTSGATIEESAYLANYAGGLVCEEVGIVPIEIDHLFNHLNSDIK